MNPNRESQRQELSVAVETAEQIVTEQEFTASQEATEVAQLEAELREAELVAEKQKEAEEKGQETERRIAEVAGV